MKKGKIFSKTIFKLCFLWSRYGARTGTGIVTGQSRNRNRKCSGTGTVPYPRVRASIRHAVWRAGQLSARRRMSGAPGRA
jgi:hypothetical protein